MRPPGAQRQWFDHIRQGYDIKIWAPSLSKKNARFSPTPTAIGVGMGDASGRTCLRHVESKGQKDQWKLKRRLVLVLKRPPGGGGV
jgi:hypothetical protein